MRIRLILQGGEAAAGGRDGGALPWRFLAWLVAGYALLLALPVLLALLLVTGGRHHYSRESHL